MHNKFMELHKLNFLNRLIHGVMRTSSASLSQAPRQWCSRSVKREAKTRVGAGERQGPHFFRPSPPFPDRARLIFAYVLTILSKILAQTSHRPVLGLGPPANQGNTSVHTIFQIAGDFFSGINHHHIGFPLSTLIYYAICIHGPTGDILIVILIVCVNKL